MDPKSIIRKQGKSARAGLSAERRTALDGQIIEFAKTGLDWADYERIMLFLPIERHNEINLWPLVRWLWAEWPAVSVYVPVVRGEVMYGVQITPLTTFKEGKFGTTEPDSGAELTLHEPLDVILTPLLGFDSRGHRVGYGGGYYDRFFAKHPQAQRVGVGYEVLRVDEDIPAGPHDLRLGLVITEQGMVDFCPKGAKNNHGRMSF